MNKYDNVAVTAKELTEMIEIMKKNNVKKEGDFFEIIVPIRLEKAIKDMFFNDYEDWTKGWKIRNNL